MKTLVLILAVAAPLWVLSQGQPPAATPPPVAVPAPAPQYQIVIDTMAASLVIKVNELMVTGWQPAGGVTTSNSGRPDAPLVTYYQAMIRTGAVMKLK